MVCRPFALVNRALQSLTTVGIVWFGGLLLLLASEATQNRIIAAESSAGAAGPSPQPASVDFVRQVAPIFKQHCLRCHGPSKQEGGLRLHNAAGALAGGDSGPVIQPGDGTASHLIDRIGIAEEDGGMPPEGERLTKDQVAALRAWIDQGARWPRDVVLDLPGLSSAKASHWSFQPIERPPVPTLRNGNWVRNKIDAFVVHRLEQEGLTPSLPADRETLIRRVTLDLIGLPPTVAEIDVFLNDDRPGAWERLVERLLASPHYGEKWARPWLDLCHYADSDGYLTDQLRPVAWRYRAWLVDALNGDLPFDQFTIEQLAGDLLPRAMPSQRIATGFLRQTLSNREGGADLEEFRVDQVVDRTSLTGTVWLGLTVGCARCHAHKYDPISQREFYQLYAFFDNADEVNIDAPLPGELEPFLNRKPEYDKRRREVLEPVAEKVEQLQKTWEAKLLYAADHPAEDYRWDRYWEVLGLIWGGQLGEGQLEGCEIVRLDWNERTQDQKDRLLYYFLQYGSPVDKQKFSELKLSEVRDKLAELEKQLHRPTRAPTVRAAVNMRTSYVHMRGDFRDRGINVVADTPTFLPPFSTSDEESGSSNPVSGRLKFARWVVSPDNPLTPRVTVNRMWQELFGRGIVTTAGDFGTQGARPSHPQLLDWLAEEFIARQWSVKAMHRLIVTSATYRQSSHASDKLLDRDPQNILLARQSSLRFSAEQIRDATLVVSGLLSSKIGGPSVRPPQPESVIKEGFGGHTWTVSEGRDRYRRGLYTFILRTSPFGQMVTFDGPDPSETCTHRERSNTPLQALTLLNDPVFFEAAQALARRILREKTGSLSDRIEHGFRVCVGRYPTSPERDRLVAYYQQQEQLLRVDPQAAQAISPETINGIEPAETAAWIGLSTVFLNLHEFITRN